jgi:hypothetical protein
MSLNAIAPRPVSGFALLMLGALAGCSSDDNAPQVVIIYEMCLLKLKTSLGVCNKRWNLYIKLMLGLCHCWVTKKTKANAVLS